MNPQDLLMQAAKNLRQAAQARQQEVKDLEQSLNNQLREQEDEIKDLKVQEGDRLSQAADADDSATTASRNREARMLRQQESHIKSAHDQLKRDTDQVIKIKRRNIDDINNVAQSVEQWAQM